MKVSVVVVMLAVLCISPSLLAQDDDDELRIRPNTLRIGLVGRQYSEQLEAQNGRSPYQWSLSSGALPAGLSLDPNSGRIEGVPTEATIAPITVRVIDANSQTATWPYLLTIAPAGLSVTNDSPLPAATAGVPYAYAFQAAGGIQPYQWSLDRGPLPAGLNLSPTGELAGVPTATGTFSFRIRVRDSRFGNETKDFELTVAPPAAPPVSISTSSLAGGNVGVPYSATLSATGGSGSYTWSIVSGTLPSGLALSPNGAISGSPQAVGTAQFTVRCQDTSGSSATRALAINIAGPALSISTAAVPDGTVGIAFSFQLVAAGGSGSPSWSITTGSLPAGLSLSSAGLISGTPQTAGASQFTVRATDSSSSVSKALSINIAPPPITISNTSLPNGVVGAAYSQQLNATGGSGSLTWSISSGSLPAGLSLNSNSGVIAGTPQAAGTSQFTVRAAANAGGQATKALSITIDPPALSISPSTLPSGSVGVAYSQTLSATGGSGSYTWSVSSGSLPTGLSLGAAGAIAGTPQTAGTFQFTARVADSANGSATRAFSIIVSPALAISGCPTSNAGVGQAYSSRLNATNGTAPYSWTRSSGTLPPGLQLAADGTLTGTPSAAGSFSFVVRVADSRGASGTRSCSIAVSSAVTIGTTQLLAATSGTPYSASLTASGGTPPYTWSLRTGALPTGITLSNGGVVSGTPASSGSFPLGIRVTDASGRTEERQLTLSVLPAVAISGCPSTVASSGTPYTAALRASGGREPYRFSIAAGGLPNGMSLAADGTISGTPTTPGNYNFGVRAVDMTGSQATLTCLISVQSGLTILPIPVPDATLQVAYSYVVQATGGAPPYAWAAEPLPPGLQINSTTGQISGTPATPGDYSFAVQVRDSMGIQANRAIAIRVGSGLVISACPAAAGAVAAEYSSAVTSIGGSAPVSWTIASGSLPAGLSLDGGTGAIAGTPQAGGSSQFVVQAADARGASATRTCTIDISSVLTIVTTALPAANVGSTYAEAVNVAGGTAPHAFSTTSGSLPPGLLLNSATGQISGTPTDRGTFPFTVRVSDQRGSSAEREFSIAVTAGLVIPACPAPVAVTSETYSSNLQATLGQPPYTWSISAGSLPAGLSLNAQTGIITGAPATTGASDFNIRVVDSVSGTATRSCTMIVNEGLLSISGADALPEAFVGVEYAFEMKAAGGKPPHAWAVVDGVLPEGLRMDSNGRIAGIPSAAGPFAFVIQVTDSNNTVTSRQLRINVQAGAAPSISFTDLPEIVGPAQQVRVALRLESGYAQQIDGQIRMSFVPDPGIGVDDGSIQFSTGGRRVSFLVPSGETAPVFSIPELRLQTGTVAGTIELAIELSANGASLGTPFTKSMRIDRLAPRITNARIVPTSSGFEIRITGFSTTRDIVQAGFRFTAGAGSNLENSDLVLPMSDASRTWFGDTRSHSYGSQFLLVQPFTVQNATLSSVTVTLTNGQGTSQPVSATF